jgi:hypothetical protein
MSLYILKTVYQTPAGLQEPVTTKLQARNLSSAAVLALDTLVEKSSIDYLVHSAKIMRQMPFRSGNWHGLLNEGRKVGLNTDYNPGKQLVLF